MKTCQRCSKEVHYEDQNFCSKCGWDLSKDYPKTEKQDPEKPLGKCENCNTDLSRLNFPKICPDCGAYLGFNGRILPTELIEIAKNWTDHNMYFCMEVLGLDIRVCRALYHGYYSAEPIQVLALSKGPALSIKNFGEVSYDKLNNARNNWKPESK